MEAPIRERTDLCKQTEWWDRFHRIYHEISRRFSFSYYIHAWGLDWVFSKNNFARIQLFNPRPRHSIISRYFKGDFRGILAQKTLSAMFIFHLKIIFEPCDGDGSVFFSILLLNSSCNAINITQWWQRARLLLLPITRNNKLDKNVKNKWRILRLEW